MAGDWIKIEHILPDKPEVVTMANLLKIDQDAVVGKLLRLWVWADQNSIDGHALTVTENFIDRLTFTPGFSAALRKVSWLEVRSGSLSIPNFDRHNGQTAKSRAVSNRRMAKHRSDHGNDSTVTNVTPSPLQKALPEKRREDHKTNTPAANIRLPATATTSPLPEGGVEIDKPAGQTERQPPAPNLEDFETFWTAYPKKLNKADAIRAWNSIKKHRPALPELLKAIDRGKSSESWQKQGGQFIPHPGTWLRTARWEDELEPTVCLPSSSPPNNHRHPARTGGTG